MSRVEDCPFREPSGRCDDARNPLRDTHKCTKNCATRMYKNIREQYPDMREHDVWDWVKAHLEERA